MLSLERRLVEDLDRSVRYALIVYGVANTAAVLVLTRSSLFVTLSPPAVTLLKVVGAAYFIVALVTLAYAIRSFRPKLTLTKLPDPGFLVPGTARPLLVVFPSPLPVPTPEELDRALQQASGEDLSRELTVATLTSKAASDLKYAALERLYTGLSLMLLVGALLLVILGVGAGL